MLISSIIHLIKAAPFQHTAHPWSLRRWLIWHIHICTRAAASAFHNLRYFRAEVAKKKRGTNCHCAETGPALAEGGLLVAESRRGEGEGGLLGEMEPDPSQAGGNRRSLQLDTK